MPAKAGIHGNQNLTATMDSRFRGNDSQFLAANTGMAGGLGA